MPVGMRAPPARWGTRQRILCTSDSDEVVAEVARRSPGRSDLQPSPSTTARLQLSPANDLRGRVYAGQRRRRSVADEIFQAEPEAR
jgi:hypothetical protein